MASIYKQCIDEAVQRIKDLDLPGINDASIVPRKMPYTDRNMYHGITVSWSEPQYGARGINLSSTVCRDMIGYPVHVTICEGTSKGWDAQMERLASRAQLIRREFHLKRATTVTGTDVNTIICKVVPGQLTIPREFIDNKDFTQLTILFWFLEPRTLTE